MAAELRLLVCSPYFAEAQAIAQGPGFDEVTITALPEICTSPQAHEPRLSESLPTLLGAQVNRTTLLVGACYLAASHCRRAAVDMQRVHCVEQCFHLIAPPTLVDHLLRQGCYLVTPGWLRHWRRHLEQWGFDQQTARECFGECSTRVVLLDTGLDPDSGSRLAAFAAYLGLPGEVLPVGLDHFRLLLEKLVGERRGQEAVRHANRRLADHALTLETLVRLTHVRTEAEAAATLAELCATLFGAGRVVYAPVLGDSLGEPHGLGVTPADAERLLAYHRALGSQESHLATEAGFCLRLAWQGEALGVLLIEALSLPAHRREYLEVALAVGGVCGLALANARAVGEREQMLAALARSNEDLTQFAYIASHDLKEPLRTITGYLQLLGEHCAGLLDAEAQQFLDFTVDGAARMRQLITDLLTYSRVGTHRLEFAAVDLQQTLATALQNLAGAVSDSGATISAPALPRVVGDPGQLAQLLQNLLGNGLKYRGAAPPRLELAATREGSHWRIGVRDNGIGLDMRFAERIFGVFERLHPREDYPGTGIGLAICRRIVERHGGRLWVDSEPGLGSTFYFTLPAA